MGRLSGDQFANNLTVNLSLGYPTQAVSFDCDSSNNAIDVNCNSATDIDVDVGNGECVSGTATITVRARDTLCLKTSNALTFQVTVQNVCLPQQKMVSPDPAQLDQFGSAVAIDGSNAVVVATGDDEKGMNSGAAYAYRFNGTAWVQLQKLIPTNLEARAELRSAAISGNTMVLGSPFQGGTGAIFIYRFNGTNWVQGPTVAPSQNNGDGGDLFGYAVAISGNLIAVGAPGNAHVDTGTLIDSGSVFVYQDNGTTATELDQLRASNSAAGDFFGASVGVSGARVVVGAPSSPLVNKAAYTGKAYVYTNNAGTFGEAILTSANAVNGSEYGTSVGIDGTRAVVGVPGTNAGAVISFNLNGANWVQAQRVTPQGANNGDRFGSSLSISGTSMVVGTPSQNAKTGSAYFYRHDGSNWNHVWLLMARMNDRNEQDVFGESVGVSGGRFITGARLDDDSFLNSGSVFIINLP